MSEIFFGGEGIFGRAYFGGAYYRNFTIVIKRDFKGTMSPGFC